MKEKWSFLSSSPGACLEDGGQGKGQHVGRPPGTCAEIHITEGPGPLAAVETGCGRPREEKAAVSSAPATTEKQLPTAFPFPGPHEKFSGGEREEHTAHSRSECENLSLADRRLTMRRGQHHRDLGAPGNLGEV